MPSRVTNERFAAGAVILAAGASRRMGRPKLLLPWGRTTVLGHLLEQCERLQVRQVAIVGAPGAEPLEQELDRLRFLKANRIYNAAPERGMFSSIVCAANWPGWTTELTHWVIMLGDQPHLHLETLEALLDFGASHPDKICQPLRKGHRRHPVLLPAKAFLQLRNCSAGDLKAFLQTQGNELAGFESGDAGLDLDMDTPEDYQRAQRMFLSTTNSLNK